MEQFGSLSSLRVRAEARLTVLWYSWRSRLARRSRFVKPPVVYFGDAGWVVYWIGYYLAQHLQRHYLVHLGSDWRRYRYSLLHFGSATAYFGERIYRSVHPSNTAVVLWAHGQETNPDPEMQQRLANVKEGSAHTARIVVTCRIGENTLRSLGVDPGKIIKIPHGVDTQLFHPPSADERARLREELEVPEGALCIGSFQKDGVGWAEGMSPKWVKGPDTFLQVLESLPRRRDVLVLLTGPARGYVKAGLEKMGVPYRHIVLDDYRDVARLYWALDLYLIASRDEGGPMGLLESMASGVPVVSTRVGMCADLIVDGENGVLAEVDDVSLLAAKTSDTLDDAELRSAIARNALRTVKAYDWAEVADQYHRLVYEPLVSSTRLSRMSLNGPAEGTLGR